MVLGDREMAQFGWSEEIMWLLYGWMKERERLS